MGSPLVKMDLDQMSRIIRAVERIENLPLNLLSGRQHGPVPKPNLRHFELAAHLPPGGTAAAYPRDFDGTDAYDTDVSGTQFDVHDMLAIHRGRARGAYSSPHDIGSLGIAQKRNGLWQIISMQPHAAMIRCKVDMGAGLLTSDAVITVDQVFIVGPPGAILAEGPVTQVINYLEDEADDNGVLMAYWEDDIDDAGDGGGTGGTGSGGSGADGRWISLGPICPA